MNPAHDYLEFTGERIIPELENYFFYEHLARYRLAKDYISRETEFLDVGCGDGYGTFYLSNFVKNATGIDVDEKTISIATKKYRRSNLSYKLIDPSREIILDKTYDFATCFEVFEHIEEPEHLLMQIKRSLRTNSRLMISTPNIDVYGKNLEIPFHEKEYTLDEFKGIISNHFYIDEVYGQTHRSKRLKRWNFFLSRMAMKFPLILKLANLQLSRKSKKYLNENYFDSLDLSDNLFSKDHAEKADYFIILCSNH